jgi:xanthine dehydrogenase accessory factor
MAGSVSGGCLEADVYLHAQEVLETGRPKVVSYGLSDDLAWEVGLACGGGVDILIEKLTW